VYLDKPMKNHTLMQTIARANRRAPGKTSGVIVDYVGVFQNLQKALAIYATKETAGSAPIQDKDALVAELEEALAEARKFCTTHGVDVDAIFKAEKLARLTLIGQAVDLLTKPEPKLTKAQEIEVKKVARDLLLKLQDQLSFDWRKTQETRGGVKFIIRQTLNELPEEPYPRSFGVNRLPNLTHHRRPILTLSSDEFGR
jgi:type I site-specific restriction-modification system R (restriction) subunit